MKISMWSKGPSARRLARELGIKVNDSTAQVFIRWKRMDFLPEVNGRKVYNKREAVALASNKFHSLQVIQQAGVKTVPVARNAVELIDRHHDNYILFGRDFYHTQGRDIEVIRPRSLVSRERVPSHQYYTRYVKPDNEYRYHVAFGKVILPTKKKLAEGEVDDSLIRNHQDGKWVQVVSQLNERWGRDCIKAVKALGLDFGAVDFLVKAGELYILEVNTAPGLKIDNRLEAYALAFTQEFERR